MARAIPKKVHAVNRVVYVFAGRDYDDDLQRPIPLSITPSSLTGDEIELVRAADSM